MSILLLFPLALALVALQATIANALHLAGGHPDLVLVGVALWTIGAGRRDGFVLAILCAPLYDAVAGFPLGVSVAPLLTVAYLAGAGERTLFGASLGWPVFMILLATVTAGLITLAELYLLGWQIPWTDTILRVLLPTAVLNAILVVVLYVPVQFLRERAALASR